MYQYVTRLDQGKQQKVRDGTDGNPEDIRTWQSKAVPLTPWRRQGEDRYNSYSLLTSELDGQPRAPAVIFPLERIPGTHLIGGRVDLRNDLDTEATGI